jgi:hypothetical protein
MKQIQLWIKQFAVMVLIVAASLSQTGCGKLRQAIEATNRLAAQVENLHDQTEKLYDAGQLSKETSRKISVVIKDQANPAVKAFVEFVADLKAAYPNAKDVPSSKLREASVLFRAAQKAIRSALEIFGVLTPAQSAIVGAIIDAIEDALRIIGAGFSYAADYQEGGLRWKELA